MEKCVMLAVLRIYAMAAWVQFRFKDRYHSRVAEQLAARSVCSGKEARPLAAKALHRWLRSYVVHGGRLQPSMRGRHMKAESFLADPAYRDAALKWLRANIQAGRAPKSKAPPLTAAQFQAYINNTLLRDVINDPASSRKPIGETTGPWSG